MVFDNLGAFEEKAQQWARQRHPDASPQKIAAFINSATYARYGFTGRYGGPSVREHVANQWWGAEIGDEGRTKPDEELFQLLEPWSFGPLQERHIVFWALSRDICHDNDSSDVAILDAETARMSVSALSGGEYRTTRIWPHTLRKLQVVSALRNEPAVKVIDDLLSQELARLRYRS